VEFWTEVARDRILPSMQRVARLALAWSLCALALGCRAEQQAAWLELRRVEPSLLEPGGIVRVEGKGFPVGQACELRLRGQCFRPGLQSVAVAGRVPCRALSDELVAATLDEPTLRALGQRGSFEGALQVAFRVRSGEGLVTGTLPVRLDLGDPSATSTAAEQRLRQSARKLLDFGGIAVADEEPVLSGLVAASARLGSRAAELGLRRGDVIERAGGVSVHSLADLAPPAGAQRVALRVLRSGQSAPLELWLPLQGLFAPNLSAALSRLSALLAWLFVCVLSLSPLPSAVPWLVRNAQRLRHGPPPALGLWGGTRSERSSALHSRGSLGWFGGVALQLVLSAAGVALVWLEPAGLLAVRSLSLYLGFAALSIMLTLLSEQGTPSQRLRVALGLGSRMLVMGLLIACACALHGTRCFDGMVEGQGSWPWRWALLQKPALLLAFPLYVIYASRLGAATLALQVPGRAALLLEAERVLTNVVLCGLGVAIFAGGWRSPLELEGLDPRLAGAVCFVLKLWAFALLLSLARRLDWGERLPARAVALWCAATVALTALWLWLEPDAVVELTLGRALALGLPIFALLTAVRAAARPRAHEASALSAGRPESA
jgi:hypothetical protein